MYQVSIFNNGVETVIHAPLPDSSLPHVLNLPFKESLSTPGQLSFLIPFGNPGYNQVFGIKTKVKVYDTRDNSVIFSGRVVPVKDGMTGEGKFNKTVTCEGALAYLNDSQTRRWNFANQTPLQIITYLLNQHNAKVDNTKKVYVGNVELTQPITVDTNHETTLNTIVSKIRNVLGGDIRVRETRGLLYLDYLTAQGSNNEVTVRLGYNLKEIIREYDSMEVSTRIIPLGYGEGINQLGITNVNNGNEYIDDAAAIDEYGVIEAVATNKDIQNADTLKIYGQTVLTEKRQPRFAYSITALDLSVLSGHEGEKYDLGDTLHTIVDTLGIDVYARVIERERDLILNSWNPRLTISTRTVKLTDQIVALKQRNLTLENAPQGNTCIFSLAKGNNADASHPMEFDLDIPEETININRVYINLHGRRYRAYERSITGGSSSQKTSGSSNRTTTGQSNKTSAPVEIWGRPLEGYYQVPPKSPLSDILDYLTSYNPPGWDWQNKNGDLSQPVYAYKYTGFIDQAAICAFMYEDSHFGTFAAVDLFLLQHEHDINHQHDIDHTHGMDHTHDNSLVYGIYEGTYPNNVNIIINGQSFGVSYGDGSNPIDYMNLNITPFVHKGNNKIQITTSQNGWIDATVYSQIFIQSK